MCQYLCIAGNRFHKLIVENRAVDLYLLVYFKKEGIVEERKWERLWERECCHVQSCSNKIGFISFKNGHVQWSFIFYCVTSSVWRSIRYGRIRTALKCCKILKRMKSYNLTDMIFGLILLKLLMCKEKT
jgi:hypothetical protein